MHAAAFWILASVVRYRHRHLRTLQRRLSSCSLQRIEQELEQVFDQATPMAVPNQQRQKPVLPGVIPNR